PGWARRVTQGRPYGSLAELLAAADAAWAARDSGDLDAALAGHPRVGGRRVSGWSGGGQARGGEGRQPAPAAGAGNGPDEQRFGHVFLICATGRGPGEILAELNRRMAHDPATEREAAAAEIGKINALRLRKLAAA